MASFYSLDDILGVARIHPFYSPASNYPPAPNEINCVRQSPAKETELSLASFPLLHKDDLYIQPLAFTT